MFEVVRQGLFFEVGAKVVGLQDQGVSPGGALDEFSFLCGRFLLRDLPGVRCLEVVFPPVLVFSEATFCVLTGAHFVGSVLRAGSLVEDVVVHGEVFEVGPGDQLSLVRQEEVGFRCYLSLCAVKDFSGVSSPLHAQRGRFESVAHWVSSKGKVRVVRGPEFDWLFNSDDFFECCWVVGEKLDRMGLRLVGPEGFVLQCRGDSMVSDVVADGVVQLSPEGPVVLLRGRQTVGGYPRVFNVVSVDVDLLAQFGPGYVVSFEEVSLDEAFRLAQLRADGLSRFRRLCLG